LSFSQKSDFSSLESDLNIENNYKEFLLKNYKESKTLTRTDYKSDIKEFYKIRYTSSLQRIENGHLLFHRDVNAYLNSIFLSIASANVKFDFTKVKVLMSKYTWPNAFSVGDGTLILNIGLLSSLKNESQLAFVICHEAAHFFLDHSNEDFIRRFNSAHSSEFKAKIKAVENAEYYKSTKLKTLIKANLYSERNHSRLHEYGADSLGVELYLNAGYDISDVISTLYLLEKLNDPVDLDLNLYDILNIDTVAYSKSSLIVQDKDKEDVLHNDSVKTHPDCKQRIEVVKRYNRTINSSTNPATAEFSKFMKVVKDEEVHCLLYFKDVGGALIQSLDKKYKGNSTPMNQSAIVISSYEILNARKRHRISSVVSPPSEDLSNAEKDLAKVSHALRYKILSKAFYKLALDNYDTSLKDEVTLYAMLQLSFLMKDKDTFSSFQNEYLVSYTQSAKYRDIKRMTLD
jgi:hypothetical protein